MKPEKRGRKPDASVGIVSDGMGDDAAKKRQLGGRNALRGEGNWGRVGRR